MAFGRRNALKRLNGLAIRVQGHLQKLADTPDSPAAMHWIHETRNWLSQMERVLSQLGKRTSERWARQIANWKSKTEKQEDGH